jgi:hypothetical protein
VVTSSLIMPFCGIVPRMRILCTELSLTDHIPHLDLNGNVSKSLWIYFVLSTPLTLVVFGIWWMLDMNAKKKHDHDADDTQKAVDEMVKLEEQIMKQLRRRTGIRVANTGDIAGDQPPLGGV